jgi:hypothetical protein
MMDRIAPLMERIDHLQKYVESLEERIRLVAAEVQSIKGMPRPLDLSDIRVGDHVTLRQFENCPEDGFSTEVTELNGGEQGVIVGLEVFGAGPHEWCEHTWWRSTGESVIADFEGHGADIVAYRHKEVHDGEA